MNWRIFTVLAILAGHALLLAWGAYSHSPTWDEGAHLPSGLSHWMAGQFDLYRVNPPLVRMVAALPVLACHPRFEWDRDAHGDSPNLDRDVSREFIRSNADRLDWLYPVARWACIPFSLIGGLVCWAWASRLFGATAGLVALVLWCICPNVLGHGQLITPDVGAAALGVVASYFFWRWLRAPGAWTMLAAGVTLGLAELSKTTWLILLVLWPALALFYWLSQPEHPRLRWHWRMAQLAGILCVAIYVLNMGYLFEGSFTRLGDFAFASRALQGATTGASQDEKSANRFAGTWLGEIPVPLPKNYVLGIDRQKSNFERPQFSYLRGQWSDHGWHHYYLYAALIKVPLGTWLIGIVAIGVSILPRRWHEAPPRPSIIEAAQVRSIQSPLESITWRDEVIVLAPALVLFMLVSLETGFNRHLRYVLPAFPFLFVWISKAAGDLGAINVAPTRLGAAKLLPPTRMSCRRVRTVLVAVALAWSAASSLYVYPHSLSYFNELVGGPRQGHLYLNSSNVDWGQDLWYVKQWYDAHAEARPLHLSYRLVFIDPSVAGVQYQAVPPGPVMNRPGRPTTTGWPWGGAEREAATRFPSENARSPTPAGPLPGWHIMSVANLHRIEGDYEYLQEFEPIGMIGYSMNVYHIAPEQSDRLRQRLGVSSPDSLPQNGHEGSGNRSLEGIE